MDFHSSKRRAQRVRNRCTSMVTRLHARHRCHGRMRRDPRRAHSTTGTRFSHRLMRHIAHCGVSLAAATGLSLWYSIRSSTRSPVLLARPPYRSRRSGSSRLFAKSSHKRERVASLRRNAAATLIQKRTCGGQTVGTSPVDRPLRWSITSRREGRARASTARKTAVARDPRPDDHLANRPARAERNSRRSFNHGVSCALSVPLFVII
jgi:hypothetical protein